MMPAFQTLIAATLVSLACTSALAAAPLHGCYEPVRGYAASICTERTQCLTQSGYYRVVLRNPDAPFGQRRLVIRGPFQGEITGPAPCDGGFYLRHELTERNRGGTLTTKDDLGCPTAPSDGKTLQVVEILSVDSGTGPYAGVESGGTVTLTGTLGLETGFNTFTVSPRDGDEVCFW